MFMSDFPWLRDSKHLDPQYMTYPISTVVPLREQEDVNGMPTCAVVVAKSLHWIAGEADLVAFCHQLAHQHALALLIEQSCTEDLEWLIHRTEQTTQQGVLLMLLPDEETYETVSEWVRKFEINLLRDPAYVHFDQELKRVIRHPYNLMELMDLLSHHVPFPVDLTMGRNFRPVARLNSLGILDWTSLLVERQYEIFSSNGFYITTCGNSVVYMLCIDCPKNGPGILILHLRHIQTVSSIDFAVVRSIVPYLALALSQQNDEAQLHNATREELFLDLLRDLYQEPLQIRLMAVTVGLEYKQPRYVLVADYSGPDPAQFQEAFDRYFAGSGMCVLNTASQCQKICILENVAQATGFSSIKCYVEALRRSLEQALPTGSFRIALSHICHNLAGILEAYLEAKFALVIGSALHPGQVLFWYSNYMDYHLICSLWREELMQRIYHNVIERLEKYDQDNSRSLLETLEALVNYNFDINEVAEKMSMHRNTIYRRTEQINEIVSEFLNDNNKKIMLQIAVKMRTIFNTYDSMHNHFNWELKLPAPRL